MDIWPWESCKTKCGRSRALVELFWLNVFLDIQDISGWQIPGKLSKWKIILSRGLLNSARAELTLFIPFYIKRK